MKSIFIRCVVLILCLATFSLFTACAGQKSEQNEETTLAPGGEKESVDDTTEQGDESSEGESESTYEEITKENEETETEYVTPELTVTEADGYATVSTSNGLTYTARGYDAVNNQSFVFRKGLELEFAADTFANKFNRFTMYYKTTAPIRIYVTYTNHSGQETVADYYVEEGEGDFSGLIPEYINRKTATAITKITVDTCENKNASFTLYHFLTKTIESYISRYGSAKHYIENSRFKLGVDFSWGGAICYIADLTCPIPGLDNLVNKADEGRLIQQSYYGTPTIPGVYEPGEFNGSQWNYNPVQGGDKYGNDSRIIDIVVTDTSIYIKTQPQDWSLDGEITPSYMENWYILRDDYIEVKNRFVDFSGWTHPITTQEIPAFYTVSYLESFVWYSGTNSWTNDKLSYRNDLNFWGDSQYTADCTFTLRQSNQESWCAFVNASKNFGLGVYVPNADVFLAGRNAYNGTMDADDGACGYVAPLKKLRLISFEALEYSYLLTTGSVEEIRATFTENKDFTANEGLDKNSVSLRIPDGDLGLEHLDFSNEGYLSVLTNHNNVIPEFDTTEGALKVTITGGDPYSAINFTSSNNTYNAGDYKTIEVVYMIPTTNASSYYNMELFLSTGNTPSAQGGKSVVKSLVADGQYHTLTIDVSTLAFWSGKINEIRVDYFGNGIIDDVIYIKSIDLK